MSVPFRNQTAGQLPHLPLNRRSRSRLKHRNQRRFSALQEAARRLILDPLEPRVLLNGDVLALDLAAYYQDQANHDLLVRMQEEMVTVDSTTTVVKRVEILDRDGGQILSFGDLSQITGVSILGGQGNETVSFDAESFDTAVPFSFSFVGGEGTDSVGFATARNTEWTIGSPDTGVASDGFVTVSFAGVEWALGAADNEDTFIIAQDGTMSGGIDGGDAGFDTLILEGSFTTAGYTAIDPTSGYIHRDADQVYFTGLEPILDNLNVANRVFDILAPGTATLDTSGPLDFRIGGPMFELLDFNAPTNSLTITSVGVGDPSVTLNIDGFSSNFTGALVVETENIVVASGVNIGTNLNPLASVRLAASNSANDGSISLANLTGIGTVSSGLQVGGNINATGAVVLTSHAERIADATGDFSIFSPSGASPLQMPTMSSTAEVLGTSTITAGSLKLEATTNLSIAVDGDQTLLGNFTQNIIADNTTLARVASGATLNIGTGIVAGEAVSGLIRAQDTTNLSIDLTPDETGLIGSALSDFGVSFAVLTLARDTQALVNGANFGTGSSGLLAVEAKNTGTTSNKVSASLIGVTYLNGTDTLIAKLDGATVRGGGLSVLAENTSTYTSQSKVAFNTISGQTTAELHNADVEVGGSVSAKAKDDTRLTATSDEFEATLDDFLSIDLGIAAAVNQMDKDVSAKIVGGSVDATAGNVTLTADNSQILTAETKVTETTNGTSDPTSYSMTFGGTLASNELLGNAVASITSGADVDASGAITVEAINQAVMDSTTAATNRALNEGSTPVFGISVAFNLVGYDVTNILGLGIDVLLGLGLGATEDAALAHAYVEASSAVAAGGALSVKANNKSLMNATVSNAAISEAVGVPAVTNAEGMGFAMVFASNKVSSAAKAEMLDNLTPGAISGTSVLVEAKDESGLFSNSKVVSSQSSTNDGGATQVDAALGQVVPAEYRTNGVDKVVDRDSTDVGTAITLVFGDRVGLDQDFQETNGGQGAKGTVYRYLGQSQSNVNLLTTDFTNKNLWVPVPETEVVQSGFNVTNSDSVGIGGMAVRNEFDAIATARISNADVDATGDISVTATEAATLKATADIGVESSGGSSTTGGGTSLAVGGVLTVNTANARALAEIADAAIVISSGGAVKVTAENSAKVDATLKGAISSAGDSVGVLLAFNTLGYAPQNLLFQALDALIGTDIGPTTPSDTVARITDSQVEGQTGVELRAVNSAELKALINNEASSNSEAAQGASAMSAQGVLASNMLAGAAQAYIDDTDGVVSGEEVRSAAGSISVEASDTTVLKSDTLMVTGASRTNDLGLGLLNNLARELLNQYQFTTHSGTKLVDFGDKVYIGDDFAVEDLRGKVFKYMGTTSLINLGSVDFAHADAADFWKELTETNVIPDAIAKMAIKGMGLDGGTAEAYYALVSRNEAEGGATAFIDDYTVHAQNDVTVSAREMATLTATEGSTVSASDTTGGIIATNELNSRATAFVTDSDVDAVTGDINVKAMNVAVLDATTLTEMSATSDAVSVILAFNSVGYDGSNILFQAIDAILGSDYLVGKDPAGATAYAENSTLDAGADVTVAATSSEKIHTLTSADAQAMDDMADAEDDEDDKAQDAAALEALKAELDALPGIEIEGDLTVETIATQSQWYVSDASGKTWQVKRNFDTDALEVFLVNLIDARVGNAATSTAKNDRALYDGLVTQAKPENKDKSLKDLEYGANGSAAGGVLASNRIATETKAWIKDRAADFTSAQIVNGLQKGDLVQVGAAVYEYVGADQLQVSDFDFTSRGVIATLESGDLIRMHEDGTGFSEGQIYVYTGATLNDVDVVADFGSLSLTLANPALSINLNNATQSYATNADWELRDAALPAGAVNAGGTVSVTAEDNANMRAESSLEVTSVVINNNDAFAQIAAQQLSTQYRFTTKSGTQDILTGDLVYIASDVAGGVAKKIYEYKGAGETGFNLGSLNAVTLAGADWEDITGNSSIEDAFPNVGNTAKSNSRAYGGIIVTNEVTASASAEISDMAVTSISGNITVEAIENATMLARMKSDVTSSGGSAWGTGESLAVNGSIATNIVMADATARVKDSVLDAQSGNVSVTADNAAVLDARAISATNTGDTGVGVLLSFNTLGWKASNLLFNAVDAIIADPLISEGLNGETPSNATAEIINSDVNAGGTVSVTATSSELLNSTVSNTVTSDASAQKDASGKSVGVVLASNKVSGAAYARIDNSGVSGAEDVTAGGTVAIEATDNIRLYSNSKIVSSSTVTNDGGAAVGQETLNDQDEADWNAISGAGAQVVDVKFGHKVRLGDSYSGGGDAGSVYVFLGADSLGEDLDINGQDYSNTDLWKLTKTSSVVPEGNNTSNSDSLGVGTMLVYNDLRSQVEAAVMDAEISTINGDIKVIAIENATMQALIDALTTSSGGNAQTGEGDSLAVGAIIATNIMLGGATAKVLDSTLTANEVANSGFGNVLVQSKNTSSLTAENKAVVEAGAQSVSVLLAFNSVGWSPSNVLFNSLDALIGDPALSDAFNGETPVNAEAFIINATVDADGEIRVNAENNASVLARMANDASTIAYAFEGASGEAYAFSIGMNKLSGSAKAYIDAANFTYEDGTQFIETGDRVVAANGKVYEYTGNNNHINLATTNYLGAGWTEVYPTTGFVNDIDAGDGLVVLANDINDLDAKTELKVVTEVTNDGGLSVATGLIEDQLNDYHYTTLSGVQKDVRFGQKVLIGTGYTDPNAGDPGTAATAGQLYIYTGLASLTGADVDMGAQDYGRSANWTLYEPIDIESLVPDPFNLNTSKSDGTGVGGVIAMNDARGSVVARVVDADVDLTGGSVLVKATENASINVLNNSAVKVTGGSTIGASNDAESSSVIAVNAMIATNLVQADALAEIVDSDISNPGNATRGVSVIAENTATIDSTVDVDTRAFGGDGDSVAVGVTLAFNSIGADSNNFLFNTVDALFGLAQAEEIPSLATAQIVDTNVTAGGTIKVDADSVLDLDAEILNAAMATAISAGSNTNASYTIAPIVALNRGSSGAVAQIDGADTLVSTGGDIAVTADDTSNIRAEVVAAALALAASADADARSVAVSVSYARNVLRSTVDAGLLNSGSAPTPVSATAGEILVAANRRATIDAQSVAVSAGISASISGSAPAISVGGAVAINRILGAAEASVEGSVLKADSVVIDANSASTINATVIGAAASVAVSPSETSPAVAIGVSVADNQIGWQDEPTPAADHTSDETVILHRWDVVEVVDGGHAGKVFEYIGSSQTTATDLSLADYGNTDAWQEIGLTRDGARTSAFMKNSDIQYVPGAHADLVIEATTAQQIAATVLAGAVAVSVGKGGVAVGGTGAYSRNKIAADADAYILGDAGNGINVNSVRVDAIDSSSIDAFTGAASVGVSVGTSSYSAAVSIGVSIALNEISNKVEATIEDADVTALGTHPAEGGIDAYSVRVAAEAAGTVEFDLTGPLPVSVAQLEDAAEQAMESKVDTGDVDGDGDTTEEIDFIDQVDAAGDAAILTTLRDALNAELDPAEQISGTMKVSKAGKNAFVAVAEDGRTFNLTFVDSNDNGTLDTIEVRRASINAVSLAASLAVAVGSSTSVAVSGAGAYAVTVPAADDTPYFMYSIEIDSRHLDDGHPVDQLDLYIGNPGSAVSSGICYGHSQKGMELRNFYFFFDAKRHAGDIREKIVSNAHVPWPRLKLDQILWPEMSAQTIVVANKRMNDGLYFSRIPVGDLIHFMQKLNFPPSLTEFARENQSRLAHHLWDVGYDYLPGAKGLDYLKGSYYGIL